MAERDLARRSALMGGVMDAPHAHRAHERTEHLMPLMVAAGAAVNPDGTAAPGRKVFEDCVMGGMSLSAYLFE